MRVKYIDLARQYDSLENLVSPVVEQVLKSGQYILGDHGKDFENRIAEYTGAKYALGVANGTDALIMSLKALNVGFGDEVITAPNSFVASAGAIAAVGARPVFVDVCDDYTINPDLIEQAITKRTKAIMPVHLTGRPADMPAIMDIAREHNLPVVEDAAQAIGAKNSFNHVGTLGQMGCFSLHPLKTLNALGDAGFIITNNEDLYDTLKKMRNHGLKNRDEVEFFGYNSRLDEIQAAILVEKIPFLDRWNNERRVIAQLYRNKLKGVVELPLPERMNELHVYHTFIIQTDKRNELQDFLKDSEIETKIHYPIPIHLQQAAKYLGYKKGDFPVAERQAERILSLPIYQGIPHDHVEYVVETINKF